MVKHRLVRWLAYTFMLAFFVAMWIIGEGSRKGTDDRAQEVIMDGNSGYHRWFKGLGTPNADTEKLLFALQGSAGCVLGGYCLYRIGRARSNGK
jgi:cobalt transport protein